MVAVLRAPAPGSLVLALGEYAMTLRPEPSVSVRSCGRLCSSGLYDAGLVIGNDGNWALVLSLDGLGWIPWSDLVPA